MAANILFLTFWYPNPSNRNFGVFIKRHAHAIAVKNKITVLSMNIVHGKELFRKSVEVSSDEKGVETHRIFLYSRFNKLLYVMLPLQYLVLSKYINATFATRSFNVLHSNVLFPCAIVGARLAKKLGIAHVITEHWSGIRNFFDSNIYSVSGRKALDGAAAITSVSQVLAEIIGKHTNNAGIVVVPNVVDTTKFKFLPQIHKNSVLTFIAVAHWRKPKNPFLFLNALQQLYDEKLLPEFRLVMVGTGVIVDEVKKSGFKFTIDFIEELDAASLCMEYNRSHIFLHGSDFETFSVVIAEALACGLPSVASPVGIAPEVINDTNGFISLPATADWKMNILKCSQKQYSPQLIADQLGDQFSETTVACKFEELYAGLSVDNKSIQQ